MDTLRWQLSPLCRRTFPAALLLLILISALSGCGGSSGNGFTALPTAPPTTTQVVPSQAARFTTADGATLSATLYGQGTRAVILSNEGDNNSAPWRPVAELLASQGYLVLHYAYRARGASLAQLAAHALTDLHSAIAFLRARPLAKLILIGASLGALVSLKAAVAERFDGVVAISSPAGFQDIQLSDADLQQIATPKLFVTSENNQPFTDDTLHMFDLSPEPKAKHVYPGDEHGTRLFGGASGPALLSALLGFVQWYAA